MGCTSQASEQANQRFVLIYFNGYGRGEPIRLLLNHAGATFKDERIELS